jgi:hypothetical protein
VDSKEILYERPSLIRKRPREHNKAQAASSQRDADSVKRSRGSHMQSRDTNESEDARRAVLDASNASFYFDELSCVTDPGSFRWA